MDEPPCDNKLQEDKAIGSGFTQLGDSVEQDVATDNPVATNEASAAPVEDVGAVDSVEASALGADGSIYSLGKLQPAETILSVKQLLSTVSDISVTSQSLFLTDDTRDEEEDLELLDHELISSVKTYAASTTDQELVFAVMVSHLKWVPRSKIKFLAEGEVGFPQMEVLLEANYPEDLSDVPASWQTVDTSGNMVLMPKYYTVRYGDPSSQKPISLVVEFDEPVLLCGFKVRGENYSRMHHMPKTLVGARRSER
jgi:hypothetical protein